MVALSFGDSTVKILSSDFKRSVIKFKVKPTSEIFDFKSLYPVTSLSWLPTRSADGKDWKLFGSCLDGGILHWDPNMKD